LEEAYSLIERVTKALWFEPGYMTATGKAGELILSQPGGVTTLVGADGSIVVQRGTEIIMSFVP
jgi:hypothetical protein